MMQPDVGEEVAHTHPLFFVVSVIHSFALIVGNGGEFYLGDTTDIKKNPT